MTDAIGMSRIMGIMLKGTGMPVKKLKPTVGSNPEEFFILYVGVNNGDVIAAYALWVLGIIFIMDKFIFLSKEQVQTTFPGAYP
jgi:hypothetical protein